MRKLYSNKLRTVPIFMFMVALFSSLSLAASHFRYGNISWRLVNGNTIEFKVSQAWRYSAFYPTLGSSVYTDNLDFGDGTGQAIYLNVTAINTEEDWFYGEAIIRHTYNSAGSYTAFFSSCCKIGYPLQNNAGFSWRGETLVTVGNNNNSPVSTLPAIVNLPVGVANASFTIPAADPDGDPLTYRLATYNRLLA